MIPKNYVEEMTIDEWLIKEENKQDIIKKSLRGTKN